MEVSVMPKYICKSCGSVRIVSSGTSKTKECLSCSGHAAREGYTEVVFDIIKKASVSKRGFVNV